MSWTASRIRSRIIWQKCEAILFASKRPQVAHPNSFQNRLIFSTSHLNASWMDKIKGVITGKKQDSGATAEHSFTLLKFADEMAKARKLGTFKEYMVGKSSEASSADAFKKQEGILRYLGSLDPTGQNIQISQKQDAAKELKCTMADIETTLANYSWAMEAQKKLEKLKQEGKPMPKSMDEVQKLMGKPSLEMMGKSPLDKIKGVITGKKQDSGATVDQSFTLPHFADEMAKARKVGTFKEYIVGRSSEATFADAFQKQEAILRYLGGVDPTGQNIQISQKKEAAKELKCTMADIETTLAKYSWAKEAQKKIEKLKQDGKPIPKSMAEVQKLMGNSPLDLARSNMAKTGQISRNALCPCGSKKRYKRCCGKD